MNYLEKLRKSAEQTGSIACMGLDPVVEAMPEMHAKEGILGVPHYLEAIFNKMKSEGVVPGALKLNQGFYVRHDKPRERDFPGSRALAQVMDLIGTIFPEVPTILDYKRGDIAKSSANYAVEGFECWKADAVTVSPYMGTDSVGPFSEYCNDDKGKGVYVLDRTSNKGAKDLQNLDVLIGENISTPLYNIVADKITEWAKDNPGVGAVIGATSPEELSDLAKLLAAHPIPLLIPGVGGQGGKADDVIARLADNGYDLSIVRINSSSGITHPWAKKKEAAPNDFVRICVEELHKLNEQIDYKAA